MEKLGLNEIRERYLKFFESKDHLRMKSFSLVPENDPSLLLINAGMAPLKKYFTGELVPPRKRVTTCQKCIRTPDIDNVGKTARHGTFFEMLGNFSFGDYFKEEVIPWAWEFLTEDLKMPVDKLWVTIYLDDDEAFDIWTKKVGVSPDRVVRMGKEDNFWEIGQGPCGPCSEIYFDRGEECGCGKPDCKLGCDCDRYVEFWNLVFTQFDKDENGNYNKLANPNIDTGMGLERIAAIMQGVNNLFEVDTVRAVLDTVSKLSGKTYGADKENDISIRVVTDHIRSTTFMISDGVIPSNEGRGYVLRRLLRRAARHGRLLGIKGKFLHSLCEVVINESKSAYSELAEKQEYIKSVIENEEEKFNETLEQGLVILKQMTEKIPVGGILPGQDVFKLYDTFGFPPDLTSEILAAQNIGIDMDGFKKYMDEQKAKARAGRADNDSLGWDENVLKNLDKSIVTSFVGYETLEADAKITAVIENDEIKDTLGAEGIIITDVTPFYGESGGQTGDAGVISSAGGKAEIFDTKKTADGKFLHYARITEGSLKVGDSVSLKVDEKRRLATARNHSVTHLLQKALRNHLGTQVEQAGSLVTPERLRFDFTFNRGLTEEELSSVEREVNEAILKGMDIVIGEYAYDEAVKLGAMALFGEKYGDKVRVVKMGDYSIELCGGTHLSNTAQAGLIKIESEAGVAAGVRRIEAVTGLNVISYLYEKENLINEASKALKTNKSDIAKKAALMNEEIKKLQKENEALKSKLAGGSIDEVIKNAQVIDGVSIVSAKIDGADIDTLRNLSDKIRDKVSDVFLILAGVNGEKINFVAAASKSVVAKGIHCGNIVREAAKTAGGGGGGKPDSAQAGGKDASRIPDALKCAEEIAIKALKGE